MAFNYLEVAFRLRRMSFLMAPEAEPVWYGHNEHCVLLVLCNRADKAGVCYPGLASIGRDTQLSRSAVARAISTLKEIRFITVRPPNDTRRSNTYRVNLKELQQSVDYLAKLNEIAMAGDDESQVEQA